MRTAPDLLAWTRASARLRDQWHVAAEDEADAEAGQAHPAMRLSLASALIRVARLAPARVPFEVPASALYRGEDVTRRVRALLAPPAPGALARPWLLFGAVAALSAALLAMHPIHELVEAAVAILP
jgi:hypothetical protein